MNRGARQGLSKAVCIKEGEDPAEPCVASGLRLSRNFALPKAGQHVFLYAFFDGGRVQSEAGPEVSDVKLGKVRSGSSLWGSWVQSFERS